MKPTICSDHDSGDRGNALRGGLFVGIELSKATWKLAMTPAIGQRPRIRDVKADDLGGLLREFELAKERFGLAPDAKVFSCFEAGRDGFWLYRWLVANGVENVVIDPASIEGSRWQRSAETSQGVVAVRQPRPFTDATASASRCCDTRPPVAWKK